MFKFAHPDFLYAFAALPLFVGLFLWSQWQSHRREARFGHRALLKRLIPLRSSTRPVIKFTLMLLVATLGILLLARPQFGQTMGNERRKGIEAIITLDVSQSMLANDVQPSRIERSKLLISTLIDRMENDRIGFNIFAGEAYPQLPITNDYISAHLFLDQITPGMVSLQGTNLAAAIKLAAASFTQDKEVGKAIILITDGENHEPGAVEAVKEAAAAGRRVFVLGVGSSTGGEIPTPEGVLTDNEGNIVHTKLNESACREIAQAGRGAYIHVDGSNVAQDQLLAELHKLQQTDSAMVYERGLNEQFQAVALLMLLLLLAELFILEKQNVWWKRLHIFRPGSTA